jgi:hypothetical protein
MKIFVIILFALSVAILKVNAVWSSKCKEAETSDDKVVRLIQNANCTIQEESRKFHENMNNFREKVRGGIQGFKGIFHRDKTPTTTTMSTTSTKASEYDGLDYAIDVRMFKGDDDQQESSSQVARVRRDDENEEKEQEKEESDVETNTSENTEEAARPFNLLIAQNKCRPGHKFVFGRCRQLVFDEDTNVY